MRQATCRGCVHTFVIYKRQRALGRTTEVVRFVKDRVEHRRKLTGRTVDDSQHLGQRRIPLGAQRCVLALQLGDHVVLSRAHVIPRPARTIAHKSLTNPNDNRRSPLLQLVPDGIRAHRKVCRISSGGRTKR
jgi:hypothetical protein